MVRKEHFKLSKETLQNSRWHKRVSIVMDLKDKEEILRSVEAIQPVFGATNI